jgi:hypothetical protein
MTDERTDETNESNEYGFAGGATTPTPEPTTRSRDEVEGESIAIPSGDLTGALTEAIEELGDRHPDDRDDRDQDGER